MIKDIVVFLFKTSKGERSRMSLQDIKNLTGEEVDSIIFDNTKLAMCFVSTEGKFLRANNELVRLLGYTEYELTNMKFKDITHPADLDADMDLFRKTLTGEIDSYPMTKRYFTKEGNQVWVRLIVTGIKGENDSVACFFSQIIPVDLESNLHENYNKPALNTKNSGSKIFALIKKEWKWIIAFGVTIVGGIITWETNRRMKEFKDEQRFKQVEENITDLGNDLKEFKTLFLEYLEEEKDKEE